MSIKINLQIQKLPDIDLIDYGVIDIRVLCYISFYSDNQIKNEPELAIMDTGATMSIIPHYIWTKSSPRIIQEEAYLSGIIPGPSHMLKTKIGIISAELSDETGNCYPVSFPTHLAPINQIPIILGFQDVLQKAAIHIDLKGNNNWLEFR